MVSYKPVSISKASFAFCRYSVAIMVWLSFLLKSEIILGIVTLIFLLSAILKVKRAPMIRLYDVAFKKKVSLEILVDENAMFFAHSLAFVMSGVCLLMVCNFHTHRIWYTVLVFAILKTISAFGFCPASKLYDCTLNGNCCVKRDKNGTCSTCQ
jgi:hypothetical protein